jgi:NOL1/NOP2/sun family putative RNA methylase
MLPAIILNPTEKDLVLDMCAAPGNKSSYLAQIMNNKGLIIANDIDKNRIKTLKYVLKKLGVTNTIITNNDGTKLKTSLKFNKILLDAPCSCEGTIRKKPKILKTWSRNLINKKSDLQKKLILNAYKLLKNKGVLVYSTCTIAPEENEEVINYLLNKKKDAKIEEIKLDPNLLNYTKGIIKYKNKKYNKELKKAIRIDSYKTDLEYFFICKIRKNE